MKNKLLILLIIVLTLTPIVYADYQDPYLEISKGNVPGHLRLHKFGHNEALSTSFETIWSGSNLYVYPVAATIMNLTSTDVDDLPLDTGAWNVTIYGLDAGYNMISETLQLNAQTRVSTILQYLRVYRMVVRESGTSEANEGIIYLGTGATVAGVPTNKYAIIDALYGQTFMTQYTIPEGYTGYLASVGISCYTANKGFEVYLRTRADGESWLRKEEYHMISGGNIDHPISPPMPMPEHTDIDFMGKVDVAGGVTEVNYDLILVEDGYELITNPTENVNVIGDVMSTQFIAFIAIAFVTMWIAWTTQSNRDAAMWYGFSTIWWIATMYQWIVDGSPIGLLWVYIVPLSFCIIQFINKNWYSYDDVTENIRRSNPKF